MLLLVGKVRHAIQSHFVAMATEAQREVGLGDRQVHVDQAVDDGLHLHGVIRMNLGAHGWWVIGNKKLSSKVSAVRS